MKRYLWALAAFVPALALAAVVSGSWTMPTTNTDGSAIPATGAGSLTGSVMEYGPCNATRTALASVTGTVPVPTPATSAVTPNLGPGTWCAQVRVSNTYGEASDWSDVKFKVIDAPKPGKPTNFSFD